jgi:hypothetical protein
LTEQLPVQLRETGGQTGSGAAEYRSTASTRAQVSSADQRPTLRMLFGVQRAATTETVEEPAQVHAAAARGTATSASRLPFADQIQRAFGHYDVSGIQAHVGPEAAASARAMGARAYATGDHVVLGDAADLHTAAHEAAHVVQQREGVHLSGGVGQVGDAYERHADAVADRVVQGQSAADLLSPPASTAPDRVHANPVQHKCGECGGAISGTGECTTCKGDPQHQAVPGDEPSAGTSKISTSGSQRSRRSTDPIQKQDAPSPDDQGSGSDLAGSSADSAPGEQPDSMQSPSTWGWGGDATRNVYAPCNIAELDRAAFLAFEAGALARGAKTARIPQAKGGLGITTSNKKSSKPPTIGVDPVKDGRRTRFRLRPTHAEMAPIQSAVTSASEFVEGVFHFNAQEGAACRSQKLPMHFVLTADGAVKVKQGEQEHCDDYRTAFDVTLASYATSINNVAAANRIYNTEKQAIHDALSYLGMSHAGEMTTKYEATIGRSALRDDKAHSAQLPKHPEPEPGCNEMRFVLDAKAFPGIPGTPPADLIKPP